MLFLKQDSVQEANSFGLTTCTNNFIQKSIYAMNTPMWPTVMSQRRVADKSLQWVEQLEGIQKPLI